MRGHWNLRSTQGLGGVMIRVRVRKVGPVINLKIGPVIKYIAWKLFECILLLKGVRWFSSF